MLKNFFDVIKTYFVNEKKIETIRSRWGKSFKKHRNFELISIYHNYIKKNSDNKYVDDKTWTDLNFDSVFSKLDRTTSSNGQQFLYDLLHRYEKNQDVLKKRISTAKYLKDNPKIREALQIPLLNLDNTGMHFIPNILYGIFPSRPKFYWGIYLLSFLSFISLLLISISSYFILPFIAILLTNFIINRIYTDKVYEYFLALSGLNRLIFSSIKLAKTKTNEPIEQVELIKKHSPILNNLQRKLGYLVIDKS